jgi:hypothetical protein
MRLSVYAMRFWVLGTKPQLLCSAIRNRSAQHAACSSTHPPACMRVRTADELLPPSLRAAASAAARGALLTAPLAVGAPLSARPRPSSMSAPDARRAMLQPVSTRERG